MFRIRGCRSVTVNNRTGLFKFSLFGNYKYMSFIHDPLDPIHQIHTMFLSGFLGPRPAIHTMALTRMPVTVMIFVKDFPCRLHTYTMWIFMESEYEDGSTTNMDFC